jgi:formylglycine-generating enzyme
VMDPFFIEETAVTNSQFLAFVKDTEYVTEAERFRWSFVLEPLATAKTISECEADMGRVQNAQHWLAVRKADWRWPNGPLGENAVEDFPSHPVTQIGYEDAVAYCDWADSRRLPTEHEWEYAARGGLANVSYPWGADFNARKLNIWEGNFPKYAKQPADGFIGTAPSR